MDGPALVFLLVGFKVQRFRVLGSGFRVQRFKVDGRLQNRFKP
jgi:hypothetical protein